MCKKCNHQQSSAAPLFVTHNNTPIKAPGEVKLQGFLSLGSWDKIEGKFGAIRPGTLVWEILFEDGTYAMFKSSAATTAPSSW
jgi:hypothetical protein